MQRQAIPLVFNPQGSLVTRSVERSCNKIRCCNYLSKMTNCLNRDVRNSHFGPKQWCLRQNTAVYKSVVQMPGTCIQPTVNCCKGDRGSKGRNIGQHCFFNGEGEWQLGQNPTVAFMTWKVTKLMKHAIIMSENVWFKDDVYTSIHIEESESKRVTTKTWPEENYSWTSKRWRRCGKRLDWNGIIRIGAEVRPMAIY